MHHHKLLPILMIAFTFALIPLGNVKAANFTVTTAAELQAALTEAQNNGEDDTINLEAGDYDTADNTPADTPFVYVAALTENNTLTLIGSGIDSTILKGDAAGTVLQLFIISATDESQAGATVQNLNIEPSGATVGLFSQVEQGFITVDTVGFFQQDGSSNTLVSGDDGPITVRNSTIQGSEGIGLILSGVDGPVTLTNNQITQNLFGVNLMGSNTAVEVSGNTFSSNTNLGMLLASGTGSVGFNHNIVEDHSALGVQLTTTDGAIVAEANVIRDNHGFSAASFETDTGSMTMTNNLVFGNSILGTGSVTLNTQSGLVTVTNNTVFDNFSSSTGSGVLISLNDSGSEAQVFNNIFFENSNFGTAPGDDLFVNDDTDTVVDGNAGAPVTVSHNILFDFDTTCQLDSTACTPDVTDSANNAEDPLFVDGPNGNFNLLPGSPAIGAGDPAAPALPAQDFADNPINNPPDLGALQAIAAILVDPSSINFGDVSTEVPNTETITIQNTGGLDLNVSDISLDDAANFALDFSGGGDPCGSASFTLVGGDACTLDVIFDPQGGGAFNATITIASNDSTNPAVTVTLSGTGVSTGGCAIAKQAVPNFAWLGIFLILIPWLVRFRNLKA